MTYYCYQDFTHVTINTLEKIRCINLFIFNAKIIHGQQPEI